MPIKVCENSTHVVPAPRRKIGFRRQSIDKHIVILISVTVADGNDQRSSFHASDFYSAVAEGFLTSLFKVLSNDQPAETQKRNVRELITFFFGHMTDRFYHYEEE